MESTATWRQKLFWLVVWLSVNIGTTLLNKWIFYHYEFPYPLVMSAIHMLCTWILSRIALLTMSEPAKSKASSPAPPSSAAAFPSNTAAGEHFRAFKAENGLGSFSDAELAESVQSCSLDCRCLETKDVGLFNLACLSMLFTLNIVVSNYSLQWVSVSLVQVIRATIPAITMAINYLLFSVSYSSVVVKTVLLVCASVVLATYGEVNLHVTGTAIAFFGCALAALKGIMTKRFLTVPGHPIGLLARMSMLAFFQMAFCAWLAGDFGPWLEPDCPYRQPEFLLVLLLNGTMAFFLNYSNFMLTKMTSALTVSVSGNVKNILTIWLSIVIFHQALTGANLVGTVLAMTFASYYSYLEYTAKTSSSG